MTGGMGGFWIRETRDVVTGLERELAGLDPSLPRGRQATTAAMAVLLALGCALWLHLDDPAWAAVSAFMTTQANTPATLRRGVLRIGGTLAGAGLGVWLAPWLLYDPVACVAVLMLAAFGGVLAMLTLRYGYAWLLGAITLFMVVLGGVAAPSGVLTIAIWRVLEVVVGTVMAMVVVWALMPADAPPPAAPLPLSAALVRHAAIAGIAAGLVPVVWMVLDLPNLSQMSITIAAVMAVPTLSGRQADDWPLIMRRSLHRAAGCLIGGAMGLVVLALPVDSFAVWFVLLGIGVWAGTFVHAMSGGISYVGTQGTLAIMLTLVQGAGPPDSLTPGVMRLVGILLGLATLLIVSLLLTPDPDQSAPSGSG